MKKDVFFGFLANNNVLEEWIMLTRSNRKDVDMFLSTHNPLDWLSCSFVWDDYKWPLLNMQWKHKCNRYKNKNLNSNIKVI